MFIIVSFSLFFFHIIGVPEGEERDKGSKTIFEEKIAETLPNLGKEAVTKAQEAQRVPYNQDTL